MGINIAVPGIRGDRVKIKQIDREIVSSPFSVNSGNDVLAKYRAIQKLREMNAWKKRWKGLKTACSKDLRVRAVMHFHSFTKP